jgi:hypothetical protein
VITEEHNAEAAKNIEMQLIYGSMESPAFHTLEKKWGPNKRNKTRNRVYYPVHCFHTLEEDNKMRINWLIS